MHTHPHIHMYKTSNLNFTVHFSLCILFCYDTRSVFSAHIYFCDFRFSSAFLSVVDRPKSVACILVEPFFRNILVRTCTVYTMYITTYTSTSGTVSCILSCSHAHTRYAYNLSALNLILS